MEERKTKQVVIFGTFDGVHEGHRSVFEQARQYGDELIAVIARDAVVQQLKEKTPNYSEVERADMVEADELVDETVLGDEQLSSYQILEKLRPDVICLGYDQHALAEDLKDWMKTADLSPELYTLEPYKSETFHTSMLS